MATTEATTSWQSATLAQDELWQARGGTLLISNEDPGSDLEDGIELVSGNVLAFASGEQVWYRAVIPTGVDRTVLLVRKPKVA